MAKLRRRSDNKITLCTNSTAYSFQSDERRNSSGALLSSIQEQGIHPAILEYKNSTSARTIEGDVIQFSTVFVVLSKVNARKDSNASPCVLDDLGDIRSVKTKS